MNLKKCQGTLFTFFLQEWDHYKELHRDLVEDPFFGKNRHRSL